MSTALTAAYVLHTLFAGAWVGAVLLATWKVLPLAGEGDLGADALASVTSGLTTLTRLGALVFVGTGGHMAATVYEFEGLFGTGHGHLVLAMLTLWLVMTALVEVGASRVRSALGVGKVRTAARDADAFFKAASVVGLVLLTIGGYLVSPGL